MKKSLKTKLLSAVLTIAMLCSIIPMMGFAKMKKSNAAEAVSNMTYYYQQLDDVQKGFYEAIKTAHANGVFKTGASIDLISSGAVSSADVREYSQGNNKLIKAFQVAKDAYMFDHPELFYVDFEKLTLSLGSQSGKYVAVLDGGKNSSYFYDSMPQGGVSLAISNFYGANGFGKLVESATGSKSEKVATVVRNIMNIVVAGDNSTQSSAYSAFSGRANAEGCAKLLKVCLDKLNIESLIVYGYLASESTNALARHCFNYINIDGRWLAVDLFLNEVGASEEFTLVRAEKINEKHIIKNSVYGNVEFEVPALESFKFEKTYTKNNMLLDITYNGMNASQLLYHKELYIVQILSDLGVSMTAKALFEDAYQNAQMTVDNNLSSLVYAVTATAPDDGVDYASLDQADLIVVESFENEVQTYKDVVRPFIDVISVKNLATEESSIYRAGDVLFLRDAWHIELLFDENFKSVGESVDVLASVNGKDISQKVSISNISWSDTDAARVEFDFVPSESLAHQGRYCFEIVGLVSDVVNNDTTKARPVYINFENESVKMSSVLASTAVYEDIESPKLAVTTSVQNLALKLADTNTLADINHKDLILVSKNVISSVLKKQTVSGEDAVFYHLSLNANKRPLILNDEYIQVVFPKSNKDAVSAKVYYVDDLGDTVEEVKCVVTNTGVVASINKLGNFKVVFDEQTPQTKTFIAEMINQFGQVQVNSSKSLIAKVGNDKINLSISCNEGFVIDYVLLNGNDITANVKSGSLEILKSDLVENNNLKIAFIASQKKLINAQEGFSSFDAKFFANQQLKFVATTPEEAQTAALSKGALLAIIIGVWVMLCVGIALTIFLIKKKASKNNSIQSETKKEQE